MAELPRCIFSRNLIVGPSFFQSESGTTVVKMKDGVETDRLLIESEIQDFLWLFYGGCDPDELEEHEGVRKFYDDNEPLSGLVY